MQKLIDPRILQATTAPELEEVIIGAMILEAHSAKAIVEKFPVIIFDRYRDLAEIIYGMVERKEGIDLMTVVHECMKGGERLTVKYPPHVIVGFTNVVGSSANIEHHARILYQKTMAKRVIDICQKSVYSILEQQDPFDVIDELKSTINAVLPVNMSDTKRFEDINILKELQYTIDNGFECFDTPWRVVNRDLVGFEKAEFILLAAEASVGKTAFCLNIFKHLSTSGVPVGMFVIESTITKLKRRLLSTATGLPSTAIKAGIDFRTGEVLSLPQMELIAEKEAEINQWEAYLNNRSKTGKEIEFQIRQMHKQGVQFFIIDNLSHVKLEKADRNDLAIGNFLKVLTALKDELEICIILVVHLNRDSGGQRRPTNKRLRNSGELEQDADSVIFLWRENDEPDNEEVIVTCTKRRDGALFETKLHFDKQIQEFRDADTIAFETLDF